jgi:hypothetical protein
MKYSFLLSLILAISIFLSAQKKDETRFIRNSGEEFYSFNDASYLYKSKLPFKDILVIDKRFDTTKAGYTHDNLSNKYSKIVPGKEWSAILNNYFKSNLDSGSQQTLVIIIQSFWLQSGTLAEIQRIKKVKATYKDLSDRGGTCSAELDIYVQSDSTLQALFRIDTSFLNFGNFNRNNIDAFFFLPFDSVAKRISTISIPQSISNKRKISWTEINPVYERRFQAPVLTETSPASGIYLSFLDFVNNRPSISHFKFKKGKLTDELNAIKNGKEELIEKYWGFYDSTGLYINIGMNAFKAIRQQNTYEVVGFRHINIDRDYQTGTLYAEPLLGQLLTNKTLKIFQVNMRTGRVQ